VITLNRFLFWWVGGILLFAGILGLHLPLQVEAVPRGILEHQTAGNAATVNAIHAAWQAAGVFDQARIAMIGDLVFIGIYSIGSVLGGLYFRKVGHGVVRHLGTFVLVCGILFVITDYVETVAQFIQLMQQAGDDGLAGVAAAVGPLKMAAFIGSFVGILAAFAVRRSQRPAR
jgi:hypothetical protein